MYRVRPDGIVDRVARTGGRPLGLEHLPDGRVLVCDAYRGLLAVDVRSGAVEPLVLDVDGHPMKFCNNAAVAGDGTIYFTDTSTVHGIDRWQADFVENTRTGRLLRRAPDGAVDVLLEGLAFANGVALAPDESWVVVAETGARTLVRYRLTGPLARTREWFARDLPGYPDNIALGSDGLVWVSIASPRDPVVELLQRAPVMVRRGRDQDPQLACSRHPSGPCGCRPTTETGTSCTTSTSATTCTAGVTTWSPGCVSTRAGCGWGACTSPRSRWSRSERYWTPPVPALPVHAWRAAGEAFGQLVLPAVFKTDVTE